MGLGELVAPGTLVLTDQPAEDLTALDPAHRQRDHVGIIISGSSKPERAMRPVLIVMVGVFVEHGTKVPLAEDQQPIGALRARRPYPSLGERVREMRGHGRWRGWEARWAGTVPHRLWMRSQSPCRGHGAAGIRLVGEVREAVRGHLPLSVWLAAADTESVLTCPAGCCHPVSGRLAHHLVAACTRPGSHGHDVSSMSPAVSGWRTCIGLDPRVLFAQRL